jgi:hypothetical protein
VTITITLLLNYKENDFVIQPWSILPLALTWPTFLLISSLLLDGLISIFWTNIGEEITNFSEIELLLKKMRKT